MFYLSIVLLIQIVIGKTYKTTTPSPWVSGNIDYRPYRFAKFRIGYFQIFNNNPAEILINNATQELVRKYPKKFCHINCVQDCFIKPYEYSPRFEYDYQIGRTRSRNLWQVTAEYNNSGYWSNPIFCEVDKIIEKDQVVIVTVDIGAMQISVKRPWLTVDQVTCSPLHSMGEITTKAKWY